MKTDSSSSKSTGSGSTLRSPSPHRNAYEAGMQALRPAKDNAAKGDHMQEGPRGRRSYGSNVHRIKNMFQQMQGPGSTSPCLEGGEDPEKTTERVRLSLPRAGSLNENVDHSALLKLGSTVSERVNRFDPNAKAENGQALQASSPSYSKLQGTRKILAQQLEREKQAAATNRVLLKTEQSSGLGIQDGRLDMVARFNGSTESLDSLDTTEAVSPTVSQLSAVFERASELRNNLHRLSSTPPLPSRGVSTKVGVQLNSKIISKRANRASALPPTSQEEEGGWCRSQRDQDGPPRSLRASSSSTSDGQSGGQNGGHSGPTLPEPREGRDKTGPDSGSQAKIEGQSEDRSGDLEPSSTIVKSDIHHFSLENGENSTEREAQVRETSPKGTSSERGRQGGDGEIGQGGTAEEGEERTVKEDQSGGEQVAIRMYSAVGEDSGGSQQDEEVEEDEDEPYEPESSCHEKPGLPEEEDPPPSRKICFSTGPIKVSSHSPYCRINTHSHTHTYIHTYIHTHIHTYTRPPQTHTYIHTRTHTRTQPLTRTHPYTHVCTQTHTNTHTHTQPLTHSHTHAHTHTHTYAFTHTNTQYTTFALYSIIFSTSYVSHLYNQSLCSVALQQISYVSIFTTSPYVVWSYNRFHMSPSLQPCGPT
ncbi:unnamed protein product, partial [Oncorhynchus mykiss]